MGSIYYSASFPPAFSSQGADAIPPRATCWCANIIEVLQGNWACVDILKTLLLLYLASQEDFNINWNVYVFLLKYWTHRWANQSILLPLPSARKAALHVLAQYYQENSTNFPKVNNKYFQYIACCSIRAMFTCGWELPALRSGSPFLRQLRHYVAAGFLQYYLVVVNIVACSWRPTIVA